MLSFCRSCGTSTPFPDMLEKLLQDPHTLPEVFDAIRDGLMVVDPQGIIQFFNRAAEEMTGYRKDEVIGKACSLFQCDRCVTPLRADGSAPSRQPSSETVANQRCQIIARDGRVVHILKNTVVLRDERGVAIGFVESMTDITSLYQKDLELQGLKEEL